MSSFQQIWFSWSVLSVTTYFVLFTISRNAEMFDQHSRVVSTSSPSVVFLIHLSDDSTGRRAEFRQSWRSWSHRFVFVTAKNQPADITNREKDVFSMDAHLLENMDAVSDMELLNTVGKPVLANMSWPNSATDLVFVLGFDSTSSGFRSKNLRRLTLADENNNITTAAMDITALLNECLGLQNDSAEKFPVPYTLPPHHQELSEWEKVARSSMPGESTKWLRYLLMEKQDTVVNPDLTSIAHSPVNFCQSASRTFKEAIFILLIHSSTTNFAMRQKIRTTWANPEILQQTKSVRLFVLGVPSTDIQAQILQEIEQHNDIVQGDFLDVYRNLTTKQRLGYRFVTEHCPLGSYRYVLKCDDDVLVDLRAVSAYFNDVIPRTPATIYCGHLIQNEPPNRNQSSKWYITPEEYPGTLNPTYCYGCAYILTADLVGPLYHMSQYTRHYWVDDVYFSGFVARNLGNVTYVQLPKQNPFAEPPIAEEELLERSKWFLHSEQKVDVFDRYFLAFESRWNRTVREALRKQVLNRTNYNFTEDIFNYL